MTVLDLHPWDLTPKEAVQLQRDLADRVVTDRPYTKKPTLVAGADISYNRFSSTFRAAVVVLRADDLSIVERQSASGDSPFPYIPGLLSFRELPILLQAFAKVVQVPDIVFFDGQGRAHPRRFGVACHAGLWLDVPCVGCAKSRLTGHGEEPPAAAGSHSPLVDRGETIGAIVRTKTSVNPIFVSAGHKIDLDSSVRAVLATRGGYRIPEPTRQAHLYANELRLSDPDA